MGNKASTCLYIDKGVLETAKQVGLNISKIAENALIEAIGRLTGPKRETGLSSPPRREGRDLNPGARLHRPGNVKRGKLLSDFYDFCKVDLGLAKSTAKEYRRKMRRFFGAVKKPAENVSAEDIRGMHAIL